MEEIKSLRIVKKQIITHNSAKVGPTNFSSHVWPTGLQNSILPLYRPCNLELRNLLDQIQYYCHSDNNIGKHLNRVPQANICLAVRMWDRFLDRDRFHFGAPLSLMRTGVWRYCEKWPTLSDNFQRVGIYLAICVVMLPLRLLRLTDLSISSENSKVCTYLPERSDGGWKTDSSTINEIFWPIGLQNSILRLYMSLNVESKKFCHDFIKISGGLKTHRIKEKHILQKK